LFWITLKFWKIGIVYCLLLSIEYWVQKKKKKLSIGFDVAKTGVARIGFIGRTFIFFPNKICQSDVEINFGKLGFPSVGKSTLMTRLTGTFSEVAAYEFTTLTTVPGNLEFF